ncbi:MAG: hypothetical protein M3336_12840 [Chloroflexota bacterium]|nr:hypothetical protein [Chloroflexota bacterium]
MDERRAADMPLKDADRLETERPTTQRGQPSGGLSTADLVGATPSSEREQPRQDDTNRVAEAGTQYEAPAAASTVTEQPGQGGGAVEQQTLGTSAATATPAQSPDGEPGTTPLFSPEEAQSFRSRWQDIQAGFVDEPRRAVEQADSLVAELMKQLAQGFADARANLEGQWGRGEATETEELRLALRRYRSFFDRLLSI